jgi:hypothetical protein
LQDAHFAGHLGRTLKVGQHTGADVDAFAHVQRNTAFAIKEVDARGVRDVFYRCLQQGRQAGTALQQGARFALQHLGAQFGLCQLQPLQHHIHIAHGAVPGHGVQAVPLHDGVQSVAFVLRVQLAR